MQMPESNLNIKTPTRHLLKVICGFMQSAESNLKSLAALIRRLLSDWRFYDQFLFLNIYRQSHDTRFILKFIPQIT